MSLLVIDAKDAILGRVAAYAAKQALLGQEVRIVNAEKAIVSGAKQLVLAEVKRKRAMGVPRKGPFYSRLPDRYFRRVIRGMLPYKKARGREAHKRVLCYIGVPPELADKELSRAPGAEASKLPSLQRVTLARVCEEIGGRHYE